MRIYLCLLSPLLLLARSEDISGRLQKALANSGTSAFAEAALSRKDFRQVEQALTAAQGTGKPEQAEILALRGAVAFLAGDWHAAVSEFNKAARLQPLRESDRFTLAMSFVKLEDDNDARAQLNALAAQYPDRAIYPYWLGRLDYHQRRYQSAIEKFRGAAILDPVSARIYNALGLAFDMSGDLDHARESLQKAVELDRTHPHPSAWFPNDLGSLLLRMNRPADAEAALRESLAADPALAPARYHLGRALEKENRSPEAIEEYQKAIAADPTSPDACYSLATLYRKLNRQTEADAMFAEYRKRKQSARASDSPSNGEDAAK